MEEKVNRKIKIALSAFACDPTKGSEDGYGWSWAIGLSKKGFEVHCFTRSIGKLNIEKHFLPDNVFFYYITLPFGLEKLYSSSTFGMYAYYILWQWMAYIRVKELNKVQKFGILHHVTWGSIQLGSFMHKLNIPFIFGPAGGGQIAPEAFKIYFGDSWKMEKRREKISRWFLKFNPACNNMLKKAYSVLVANPDTESMVRQLRNNGVFFTFDAALPISFFPQEFVFKSIKPNTLKLLWVGRFLPRKGIMLLLDVMNELKEYSNIVLTVVGDGEMRETFLKKIKDNHLENTVNWKGKIPYSEVKHMYASHDVFFFTSLRDSNAVQLIEAMAYGLPIVTLNLHGQAILVDDHTGIKCDCTTPNETVQALKQAILKFYLNPELIITKGEAAFQFAKAQNWDKKIDYIVQNYYPAYE